MSGEFGAVVGRRSRAEIERLAGLYRTSGMGRSEFCRSHGMPVSTLNRHLKKQQNRKNRKRLRLAVSTGSYPAVILFAMHVLTACK